MGNTLILIVLSFGDTDINDEFIENKVARLLTKPFISGTVILSRVVIITITFATLRLVNCVVDKTLIKPALIPSICPCVICCICDANNDTTWPVYNEFICCWYNDEILLTLTAGIWFVVKADISCVVKLIICSTFIALTWLVYNICIWRVVNASICAVASLCICNVVSCVIWV